MGALSASGTLSSEAPTLRSARRKTYVTFKALGGRGWAPWPQSDDASARAIATTVWYDEPYHHWSALASIHSCSVIGLSEIM